MTGGWFGALTTIVKGGSEACAATPETEIDTLMYDPACAAVGIPDRRPVEVLKLAQEGRLATEYVSAWPSGSVALGRNA